jgi:2-desacetyl-2-hydroxyethyl bacteriochlorophyllide A dehydrogenase
MQTIQALVCVEPGTLALETRPLRSRGPGEALVRPRRIGICGTDYHIFEGKHPYLNYPRVMGHELAVEVIEAPNGLGLLPGDLCAVNPYIACGTCVACRAGKPNCCMQISVLGVHADGGMAERLILPAANLIPAQGLDVDHCAAVEFLAIGAHAVRRGTIAKGDRVLVVGAGPIGLGAALFARIAGGDVTVHDRDPERLAVAQSVAGTKLLPAGPDTLAAVMAMTDQEGFDVVLDATGSKAAIETGFDFVAHGGRYVLVSVVKEPITFQDPVFHRKEMTLLGSRNATATDFKHVMQAMQQGLIPMDRIITHRTTLAAAAGHIAAWATAKSGLIKAMIEL